jgi:catechol 2,3-dioxygenase-like lactoylglutathione lyase family enzyme
MIDHVSIGVRDLEKSTLFYEAVLQPLGYRKLQVRADTVGFGKDYSEFWLNVRPDLAEVGSGIHVALRARSTTQVEAFHAAALSAGGTCDGPPGSRLQYSATYFAAFVRDPDGNRIEAVTFLQPAA